MSPTQLSHTPLQAVRPGLFSVATGLRAGNDGYFDILDLQPAAVCRNAVNIARYASPSIEKVLLLVTPFAILAYGCYQFVWKGLDLANLIEVVRSRFVGKVTVPSSHQLHHQVLTWMANNDVGTDTRSVTVHSTVNAQAIDPATLVDLSYGAPPGTYAQLTAKMRETARAKRASLSYVPSIGSTSFQFEGHSLWLHRQESTEEPVVDGNGRENGKTSRREADIIISCYSIFGSLEPVQSFLEHVRAANEAAIESQIRIHRLSKYINEGETWDPKIITRPARGLESVSMEEHKKESILKDIQTYLSHESKTWYANRGIPWRRGYLFYGPPGTGKTSFCTALAGHFDLELYIISLSNAQLTDEILDTCFDSLPPRCVVLIEDVDSAGINRESSKDDKSKPKKSKKKRERSHFSRPARVTLAGLLNTIDGPVSHEGRVLVLTTNTPDSLDPALLRPGRVDRKVLFGNASSEVVEQLFLHIFAEAPGESSETNEAVSYDVKTMAKEFGLSIPEDTLTPAEIQNYLLERRDDPVAALEDAEGWAEGVIRTKAQGRNVEEFKDQVGVGVDEPPQTNGVVHGNGVPDLNALLNGFSNGNGLMSTNGTPQLYDLPGSAMESMVMVNGNGEHGAEKMTNGEETDGQKEEGENAEGSESDGEPIDAEEAARLDIAASMNRRRRRMGMGRGGYPFPMGRGGYGAPRY